MHPHRKSKLRSTDSPPQESPTHFLAPFVRNAHSPSFHQSRNGQPKSTPSEHPSPQLSEYDELKSHYECIEKVLNQQNLNLKMQAKYLASEMRKTLKREKAQREELKRAVELYERAKEKLGDILQENMDMKEYVESKIILLLNALKLNTLNALQEEIKLIVQQFCDYFSLAMDMKNSPKREVTQDFPILAVKEDPDIGSRIEELNDKFEELMHEYKSTSRPEIRKQCIDIAKEIKTLKSGRQSSQGNKTVQMLSRQQSNEYLSLRSKYSKIGLDQGSQVQQGGSEVKAEKQQHRSPTETHQRNLSRKSTLNRPSSFRQRP